MARIVIMALLSDKNLWKELSKNTKTKYKEIAKRLSQENQVN
ncbi:hypothetical protein [Streptococcus pluranimalium]